MADNVQFIGPRDSGAGGGNYGGGQQPRKDSPVFNDTGLQPPKGDFNEAGDDDIPF